MWPSGAAYEPRPAIRRKQKSVTILRKREGGQPSAALRPTWLQDGKMKSLLLLQSNNHQPAGHDSRFHPEFGFRSSANMGGASEEGGGGPKTSRPLRGSVTTELRVRAQLEFPELQNSNKTSRTEPEQRMTLVKLDKDRITNR